MQKSAFTLLELIFVIVILGILAGVAMPKFWVTRDDAALTRIKTEVSTIESAISSKYTNLILSGNNECPNLEKNSSDDKLFEGILNQPLPKAPKKDNVLLWDGNGSDYNVTYQDKVIKFKYDDNPDNGCIFKCVSPESGDFSCESLR